LNAYRWQVAGHELLYLNPQFFNENRPTRGGFPILYPFPNRIRAGQFTWNGKTYNPPIGDPANQNAIHGFAFKRAWRVVDQGANAGAAWITGEFQGALDAPETLAFWPADYRCASLIACSTMCFKSKPLPTIPIRSRSPSD